MIARLKLDRKQVAEKLEEIGILLELAGENPFKSRSYATAARTLESLNEDFAGIIAENRLTELKGIGEAISEKIATLATTGSLPYLDRLRKQVPAGLLDMIQIPGLGPKRAHTLHEKLGIKSVEDLAAACRAGRLAAITGFGEKSQRAILEGIAFIKRTTGYILLHDATRAAQEMISELSSIRGVARAQFAGSLRRRKEVVHDIDLLAAHTKGTKAAAIIQRFIKSPNVTRVLGAGDTKASIVTVSGVQVDLRIVSDEEYPFALLYFTGSAEHNIAMRRRAQAMGLKINEYGLWKGDSLVRCGDEERIFGKLGLAFIPPELREDWGEIDAAEAGTLPDLVTADSIRGVFHVHSTWSDGTDSLQAMLQRAADLGYEYVGISDHSRSAAYAGGLSIERVRQQALELSAMRPKFARMKILHGVESDILKSGALDYPEATLKEFDFVIGSVHSSFTLSEEDQTRRVIKAIENPHLTILGHPTGRLLLQREGFAIDMDRVIAAAARCGKTIEVNASPHRLDLDWRNCRNARRAGVKVSINPDAHSAHEMDVLPYGVDTARRGWLERSDVLNTRPWNRISKMLPRAGA